MDSFGIGMAGLVMACVASVGAFVLAFRQRRRRRQAARPRPPADRIEALGAAQAELAHRLEIVASEARAPEERLQAMAGQLLGLIRDKNATFETAIAGLDQLRARMRALEQIGEPAEARALLETLSGRIDALQAAQAAAVAGIEARIETLAAPETGAAELAARLAKLGEAKAAAVEAAVARLGPLEARIAGLEGGPEALKRLEARLEALQREQGAARAELAGLKAEAGGPVKALGERLSELHAQKEAAVEAVLARLGPLEARLAGLEGRDPEAGVAPLAARLAAIEGGEGRAAEIAARLSELHAQKEAAVEAVLARLGPLEARLAGLEGRDPQAAVAALADRLGTLEGAGDRIAALGERLGGLHAQKDAAVEAALGRLAPLEARLQALEAGLATLGGRDPQDALDGLAARLEAAQAARETAEAGMRERLAAIEASPLAAEIEALQREQGAARAELAGLKAEAGGPVKALGERLSELHAQKEAAVEAVLARLGPLEARLAGLEGRDPQGALDGLAARLEAAQAARETAEAGMRERLAAIEASPLAAEIEALQREQGAARAELAGLKAEAGGPVKALGERLSELHAQKEAAVEAVLARLGPLEARLAGLEGRDPQAAVAALADRLGTLEGAGDRIAALAERLGGLHAQKDAAVEAVLARLGPLEARLAGLEGRDPEAAVAALGERLGTLEGAGDRIAALGERLGGLHAQKDAAVEAALGRLAPLEARLQALEAGLATLGGRDPQGALDGLAARLEAAHAAREAAEAGMRERLAAIEGGEGRVAEVAAQLSELHARKEAAVEAVLARLGPLEARLAGLEAGAGSDRQAEDDARAEAQAIATQLIAMRAAAAQTELFADRLALLEASLPRLSVAQSLMMQALERQAAVAGGPEAPLPGPPAEDPLAAFRDLPRIVSLHQK